MPLLRRSQRIAIAVVIIVCVALPALAGTIRHDREDAQYLDLASEYPSVGQIVGRGMWEGPPGVSRKYSFFASGTLIAPDWVLTAAHVVADHPVGWPLAGEVESIRFFIEGQDGRQRPYVAEQWIAHPSFDWGLFVIRLILGRSRSP